MISDQRYYPRVSCFSAGDVFADPTGERMARAVIHDLSSGGLNIETLANLEQGQTVYIDFEVAGKFVFEKSPALVVRVTRQQGSFQSGLTFRDGHDRRRLRTALNYLIDNCI